MKKLVVVLGLFLTIGSLYGFNPFDDLAKGDSVYYKNGIGMEFAYVAPGSFDMGSNSGRSDEKPVHKVTISKPYLMGKYEVTQSEYQKIMGSNPSKFRGSSNPVEQVRWTDDVEDFCSKLTSRERSNGNLKSGYVYRLPTEAEWEFAARGGVKSKGYKYSGSNSMDSVGWYEGNSGDKTHSVGQKSSNELGLYDMSGNVWEWCSDYYEKPYKPDSVVNPKGGVRGWDRVVRGGSWSSSARSCRSAGRNCIQPRGRTSILGFRLVLASE